RTWVFNPGTAEFYQVNSLYHVQASVDKFYEKLQFAYNRLHSLPLSIPKSIPSYLRNSGMFWFKGVSNVDSRLFRNDYINAFSQCNKNGNASFSSAGPELCFGYHSSFPGFYFVQDPTVIYHEVGHALVSIMMN